jgi:hypothetical protein
LDARYSSGTSLTVKSTVSFSDNDLIIAGEPSEEFTEEKKVNTVTAPATFTLASALSFAHNKETPVYKVLWDYVSIEGRSTSAGTFAELTQSPIQWDSKTNETIYFHSGGDDNWQYRFRFLNSVTTTYSEYSPTLSGAAPGRKTVGYMIATIRKIADDPLRKVVSDDEILRFINRAQDIVYSHNPRYWFLLVDTYHAGTGISATANTSIYSFATYTTFGHLDSIRYKYVSGTTNKIYKLRKLSDTEFDYRTRDLNKSKEDEVEVFKLLPADSSSDQGYFQADPTPKSDSVGTFYPKYYEKMADLDTVDDSTQVPLPSILEDYAIGQVWKVKGNEGKADYYEKMFFGPAEPKIYRTKDIKEVTGLPLLDMMDEAQKDSQGQPKSLIRFRGQKYMSQFFGSDATRTQEDRALNDF